MAFKYMNDKTKIGLGILEAAALLGILGDALLREIPWGLNFFLWIIALVAAMTALKMRRKAELWSKETMSLHLALIFFAAMFVWRDSDQLLVLDFMVIVGILGVLVLPALRIKMQFAGISHYLLGGIWSGLNVALAPIFLIFEDIKWKFIPQVGWTKHLSAILRGIVIVTPILVVFGGLFMAADSVYEGIMQRTFRFSPDFLMQHLLFFGVFSWLTAGYLRGSLFDSFLQSDVQSSVVPATNSTPLSIVEKSENETSEAAPPKIEPTQTRDWQHFDNSILPEYFTLGAIETGIIMGLINLLFLSFVIVQIPYLFGGMELVQNTPDFKLAEYARRGFGELVMVTALVIPMLLTGHWLLRRDNPKNELLFRIFAGIQIGLLFVIMISAMQRMLLYTGNLGYGLTSARLYPMIFMVWLGMILGWFCLTVLRGNRSQFAWGSIWSALFVLATLHFLNPDDFIVRANSKLMQEGRSFDSSYIYDASNDALPAMVETYNSMNNRQKCEVLKKIERIQIAPLTDFRAWNYSRWSAKVKANEAGGNLERVNCLNNSDSRDLGD